MLIWRTIFVVPFLFFFCIFGSYWHVIVVSNSEVASPLLCPVYYLWGQIAVFDLNYYYKHCHVSFCHSNKLIHYLVHRIYKITIIIKTIETNILQCVPPSHFGGRWIKKKLIVGKLPWIILIQIFCFWTFCVNVWECVNECASS